MNRVWSIALLFCSGLGVAQDDFTPYHWSVQGQLSGLGNYAWENDYSVFRSVRYLPQFNFGLQLDSNLSFDVELSGNAWISSAEKDRTTALTDGAADPYRAWARLAHHQWDLRVGLQKIDFGSATLLRPLQWFNQLDPRDPLQLTNGVKAGLFRYYFPNNANVWIWGLYGNEDPRGLSPIGTSATDPEWGGRVQLPVPRGELAFSYHQQTMSIQRVSPGGNPAPEEWDNSQFGLDGKWDVGVGLWFESMLSMQEYDTFLMASIGIDYTFGWGNGLYILAEGLLFSADELTNLEGGALAIMLMYPLGLYDQLQLIYYEAPPAGLSQDRLRIGMLNLQHQFPTFTLNASAYYNPSQVTGLVQNDLFQSFGGPGLRLTFVYNH